MSNTRGRGNRPVTIGASEETLDRTIQREPTLAQHGALVSAFKYFNEQLFSERLPPCMLTLDVKFKRCYGFFSPNRWEENQGRQTHGISLNPVHLKDRPIRDVISTLVHEMAHLWQEAYGHPSRRGYHNREWAGLMIQIGLMPSDTGHPGGRHVGDRMSHYVVDGGPFDKAYQAMPREFLLPWVSRDSVPQSSIHVARDRNKVTYTCPGCSKTVWGKPAIHVICGDCFVPLDERCM